MNIRNATCRPRLAIHSQRRGAIAVESSVVLSALLLSVLAMGNLAITAMHYNCMSEAARRLARRAIVRGESSAPAQTPWGPTAINVPGSSTSEQARLVRETLGQNSPNDITIQLIWPDGQNGLDSRVHVTITKTFRPTIRLPFLPSQYQLSAKSCMVITH